MIKANVVPEVHNGVKGMTLALEVRGEGADIIEEAGTIIFGIVSQLAEDLPAEQYALVAGQLLHDIYTDAAQKLADNSAERLLDSTDDPLEALKYILDTIIAEGKTN